MAGFRKEGQQWVARIHFPKGHRPSEKKIPLGHDEKTARQRRIEVERYEKDIKAGLDLSFPWMNESGFVEEVHFTFKQAQDIYIKHCESEYQATSTVNGKKNAFKSLEKVVGPSYPVAKITIRDIDKFKATTRKKKTKDPYSLTTINIRLRIFRTFFIFLKERGLVPELIKIKEIPKPKQPPKYLSNKMFNDICAKVDPFIAQVFWLYRESGLRLSEAFYSEIDGDFLTVSADTAKTRKPRDIYLTPLMKEILLELRETTHLFEAIIGDRRERLMTRRATHEIKYYSRQFKKACTAVGITDRHFHHLRHTAALRTYLKSRDLYAVARLLGHNSITTTEIYTQFDLKRLEQDFPDLVEKKEVSNEEPIFEISKAS